MPDISPVTGVSYYSNSWEDIKDICRSLNIGSGRLAKVTQQLINYYQEMVDREIDAMLSDLYWVPIKCFNQVQPDGSTKSLYPGNIVRLARYWSAGLLLSSEFQGSEPNAQEAAQTYIEDSRKELFDIVKFQRRLQGQVMKSPLRTMSPTMQMPAYPTEPNY